MADADKQVAALLPPTDPTLLPTEGGTDISTPTPVPEQPAYMGVAAYDPFEMPHGSPMSPLYDAYNELNQGYARFLESPAQKFMAGMKGYQFDPKAAALLDYTSGTSNPWGGVSSGILEAWKNMTTPESENSGGGTGTKGANNVEASYVAEQKQAQEAMSAKEKAHAAVVDSVLKDPNVVASDTQIMGYNSFKQQFDNLLNSGAVGKDGSAIFTPIQMKALATTFLQEVRPGARVMNSDGSIDSSALDMLNVFGPAGQALAAGLKQGEAGTDITLEGNDLLGIAKAASVIKDAAISNRNERILYRKANDPENAEYYDSLLSKVETTSTTTPPTPKRIAAASKASMQADAAENVERKNIKESIITKKEDKPPKAGAGEAGEVK